MKPTLAIALVILTAALAFAGDALEVPPADVSPRCPAVYLVDTGRLPDPSKDHWSNKWPHIVAVHTAPAGEQRCVPLLFNADATEIKFDLPPLDQRGNQQLLLVETAEKSQQYPDGTIVFVASDGQIHTPGEGKPRAFFEDHKGNYRIGGWMNAAEFVTWPLKAIRWGMYDVQITYSLAGGESDLTVDLGDKQLTGTIKSTGTWYKYVTVPFGRVYLDTAGDKTVKLACTRKTGGAVMNIKAIILRPAPEGADWPLKPGDDGVILLHSKDALVDGVTLRYEPKPEKNTLGFWSNPSDRAHWQFTAPAGGQYDVEVMQGCGANNGGSEVDILIDGAKAISFTVEDTGGWQSFKPRIIGRVTLPAGDAPHTLTLAPVKKAKAAVMDVRQVRLMPVKE